MGLACWLVNIGYTLTGPTPMSRLCLLVLAASSVVLNGCTHATFGFRPSLTSQVPDSTVVRVRPINGQPGTTGRSVGWQSGRLAIVTAARDTMAVPEIGTLEVRLNTKKRYTAVGGIVGVVVGTGLAMAKCPYRSECGPDLRPAIGGGIGMLIGSRFSSREWLVVKRPPR